MTKISTEKRAKSHIPLTHIQRLIGKRMLKSKQTKPCFYIELKADVTQLMLMRPGLRKSLRVKITTNAFYIRALAFAAGNFPLMLGRLDGDNITIAEHINVGFAVNAPQGLVVPVVKDAGKKTLAQIALLEKLLTDKARSNKLTLEDIESETIALSNLGAYGVNSFIGIIPPPASTIMAVGNVISDIVPENADKIVRKTVTLNLAVDHRVINGVYAAAFLNSVKKYLENPQQLT